MLEIDIKIILVQAVTFLLGVFVLWKLAWGPLVKILSKRKEDIAKNISDANGIKVEAEKLKKSYEEMMTGANEKAQNLIREANISGDENKKKIITEARGEAKKILDEAKRQMEYESEKIKSDLKQEIVPIAITIAEKVTEKMLDENTKKELIKNFLKTI